MKNIKKYLASLLIITIMLIVTFPVSAQTSDQNLNTDILSAQKSAQVFANRLADKNPDLTQWADAYVTEPLIFHNLQGEINVYIFALLIKGNTVGHLIVGSSLYDFHVFEAGTAPPPDIPSLDEINAAIKQMGIYILNSNEVNLIDLVYTGLDGAYGIYNITGQTIAVNLVTKEAIFVEDLKTMMISPEEFKKKNRLTAETNPKTLLDSDYDYLDMYYWNGTSPAYCGPCSGVSIGAYYRDECGKSSLPNSGDMYDELYDEMNVTYGVTLPTYYGSGFCNMASDHGYSFSHHDDYYITESDYWNVVADISYGHPTGLCITSDWHWRGIKGYDWVGDPYDWYYIICTDSATSQNFLYLDWNDLGYGIVLVCITD